MATNTQKIDAIEKVLKTRDNDYYEWNSKGMDDDDLVVVIRGIVGGDD